MSKLKFWGAVGEVTGSCYELTEGGVRVMIDYGMFQGLDSVEKNQKAVEGVSGLTAMVLTHAHLDHCGRLPLLVAGGFKGRIYATKPTVDLVYIVLLDSAKIAKGNSRDGRVALYMEDEVEEVMKFFEVVDYEKWKGIEGWGSFRFLDAGHILGSASVEVKLSSGKGLVFSGDLGNDPSPIVKGVEDPTEAEVIIMESTYGDRDHPPRGEEKIVIERLCKEIETNQGTLLIPAFSIERTQELLMLFDELKREKRVSEKLLIYMDGPMGEKVTAIYERYPEYFNKALQEHTHWDDPFNFPGLKVIEKSSLSKKVSEVREAKVIIAGSGMMSGGRIMGHAKKLLPDSKTVVLFTGFHAKGTLGTEVKDGQKRVLNE